MPRLALFYLGPPRIELDGAPVEVKLAKANALLAYLAVTGQSDSREALATLLWPEHDPAHAYMSLRSTLRVLNTTLGQGWLEADRKTVRLRGGDVWLDVERFHTHLAACRAHGHPEAEVCPLCLPPLAEAVNLYRADFLSGFTLRDSLVFDEWQSLQTERLRGEQVGALARLSRAYSSQGQEAFDLAVAYARRWLELDPLSEPAHQQLIQLYLQSDRRAEALRQYQTCVQILHKELGVPPSEAITALYRQLQEGGRRVYAPLAAASVRAETARAAPSALRLPGTLPVQFTPCLGRETERSEIAALLRDRPECRLVTLVGPAGIGKTRLALQVAEDVGAAFPGGVTFVSLESVSSLEFLVPTIADALQFTFYSGENLTTQLLDYLREKTGLLVLDNFEHLLPPVSSAPGVGEDGIQLLAGILQAAPGLKLLVTSQERLNLRDEWLVKVQGLSFPRGEPVGEVERYSAVQLFIQAARRVRPGLSLSPAEQVWAARICQLVDGMPLGVELAATWVRMLSCQEIAGEIERNLEFLATALRDMPERHRSLRAVFDYSWRLLPPEEQRVFQQMSVFFGGFRQEAAERVAGATLPILLSLVDRGLLRRHPSGRYDRHPLLWRYAREKLDALPAEREAAQDRHCAYYAAFLQQQAARLKGGEQKAALEAIEADIENVRLAWRWAVARRKAPEIEQALEGVYLFYEIRSLFQEGAQAFEEAARQLAEEPLAGLRAELLARQGALSFRLGLTAAAKDRLQESLALFDRAGPGLELEKAFALSSLAFVLADLGEFDEARQLFQAGLVIYQSSGDRYGLAMTLKSLGGVLSRVGDYAEAGRVLHESLAIFKALGNAQGRSQALNNLGVLASIQVKHAEAQAYWRECLAIHRELNNQKGTADALNNLGTEAVSMGEYSEAQSLLEQSLAIYRAIGHRPGVAFSLDSLGHVACGLGDYAAAHRHFREALRIMMDIRAVTYAIEVLVGIAKVLIKEEKYLPALDMLAFALNHPKCVPEVKDNAARLLSELEVCLSPQVIALAQAGRPQDLESVVAEWLKT